MTQSTQSPCLTHHCYQCCKNTNMLLSENDIRTIQNQGYSFDFFVEHDNGWLQLKNKNHRCVFHNGKRCTIYNYRPTGCRLYPVVFQKDDSAAILDKQCPHISSFTLSAKLKKQLFSLVFIVQQERKQRTRLK